MVVQRSFDQLNHIEDFVFKGKWGNIRNELIYFEQRFDYDFSELPSEYVCYLFKFENDEFAIDVPLWSDGMPTDVQVRISAHNIDGHMIYELRDLLMP